ncbi:MAG TPA: malto-oligosyltrehalose synthase [Polyangia bacterium]|nr:malto-oligosyltrehalose synthase [Polyangia bacterium]
MQLHAGFTFRHALAELDYLARLGITDLYVSPILTAARGSLHGYDVVDHGRLNPELGSEEDFRALTDALRERGMGLLVDWVPNHMGIAAGQNPLWEDVLENGPSSLYADTFDIDWQPTREEMHDTVLLPVLGDQYGQVLERGELQVLYEDGTFHLAYYEHRFPLGPRTLRPLLDSIVARTGLAESDEAQQELESIRAALDHMPDRSQRSPAARRERAREKEIIKRRLARLCSESPAVQRALDAALAELNGTPGVPTSFDALDRMLRAQGYRLASWRVASQEINYRRFFDINSLAAIRMEDPAVFERAHALLFQLMDERRVNGLRLDHTDGLYDPLGYFEKLQQRFRGTGSGMASGAASGMGSGAASGAASGTGSGAGSGAVSGMASGAASGMASGMASDSRLNPDDAARPVPLLVEKILEPGEKLPVSWPVDGTTGYEFANLVLGLWVDPAGEEPLTALHQRYTGDGRTYAQHVYECKLRILQDALASEVNMLARQLQRIAAAHRRWQDFTLIALTSAIRETIAAFPVYRTYLREGSPASEEDVRRVKSAIRLARRRAPAIDPSVFAFLQDILLLRAEGADAERQAQIYFALRFQQLTGPVMAKAVEDTAFYRYNRLLALNEVGGDPSHFAVPVEAFHEANQERLRSWPLSMVTTSTHDTKRGEDAAARIAVLSEMPAEWRRTVSRWSQMAEPYRRALEDGPAPSRRDEYTFYQALVGAWPFQAPAALKSEAGRAEREAFVQRMAGYMEKAIKEAKEEASWTQPYPEYEQGVRAFVEGLLGDAAFLADLGAFCERIGPYGATNALAQTLLRLTVPGVPDTYQGAELWHQSFVDPDNRHPVDYERRHAALAEIERRRTAPVELARELLGRWQDGALKLYVLHRALKTRARFREVFLGDYEALPGGEHLIAFARRKGTTTIVVAVPRLSLGLMSGHLGGWAGGPAAGPRRGERPPWPIGEVWGDQVLVLPQGRYRDAFTGRKHDIVGTVRIAELLADLPLTLLVSSQGQGGSDA